MQTNQHHVTFSGPAGGDAAGQCLCVGLAGQTVEIRFDWLPGERAVSVTGSESRIEIRCASGLRVQAEFRDAGGYWVCRGEVFGIPVRPPRPMVYDSALSRDYHAGGICLCSAKADMGDEDAYQRPRWKAHGFLVELMPLGARMASIRPGGSLTPWVEHRPSGPAGETPIEVRLYPPHNAGTGSIPFAFAVAAAPAESFAEAWRAVALQEKLPGAHSPEDRAKVLAIARRPTLFALGASMRTSDDLIRWASGAGFGSILLHCPVWSASDGHYLPNFKNWPRGWTDLRALVRQAESAGVAVGLHTLTTSIANHDPFVTPKPDARLMTVWSTKLARPIGLGDSTLLLEDEPTGLSPRDDYMSFGRSVRIGDEIVRYAACSGKDRSLTGCQRGAYGSAIAAHASGSPVHYLFRLFDEFAVDPESTLADEIAANVARAFGETGAEMIYFDDSEAVPDPYLGHISRYHERIWRAVGMSHLHVQASSTGPFGMYLLSRVGQQDTVIYKRTLLDRVILPNMRQYLAADLVPDFGWFGVNFGDLDRETTSVDDIDCLMSRVMGASAGVTIFGSPELTGTPLFQKVARRLAAWSDIATRGVDDDTRRAMAMPGREFRPVAGSGGLQARETRPWRGRCVADAKGIVQVDVDNPGADQPLALNLTVYSPVAERGAPANVMVFKPGDAMAGLDGLALPGRVEVRDGRALLAWNEPKDNNRFARWRLAFAAPVDLARHRALSLRYRVEGRADAGVVRLVTGLAGWPTGLAYAIPVESNKAMVTDDPQPDPDLRFDHPWPDNWFSDFVGVSLDKVEGLEIILAGLTGKGQLILEPIEALQELRPPGAWVVTARVNEVDCPGIAVPWDGTLEFLPEGERIKTELAERSAALKWQGSYPAAGMPVLKHGMNRLSLAGLAPRSRVQVRVDRLI